MLSGRVAHKLMYRAGIAILHENCSLLWQSHGKRGRLHRLYVDSASQSTRLIHSVPDRVPEECPQEIADLIASCTADAAERPDAEECAHIIAQFVPSADARRSASRSLSGRSPRPLLKASGRAASGDSTESGAATSPAGASGHGGMLPAAAAPGTEQHREHTAGIPSGEVTPDGQIVPGSPATPEGSQGCGKRPHPQASTPALKVDGASR